MGIAHNRSAQVPRDLAKRLGITGIRKLLTIMTDAYHDLCNKTCVRADSSEPSITEEWFVQIQKRWRPEDAFGLVPIPEKQDTHKAKKKGRPPTVDFCFRDEFFPQSYFGAECKLLDQGSSNHLKAYLDDKKQKGIGKFLHGKYASCTGAGAMVGYVRRGDCNVVARDVAKGMRLLPGKPTLKRSEPLPRFDQLYESRHARSSSVSPFQCFHLFFAFGYPAA